MVKIKMLFTLPLLLALTTTSGAIKGSSHNLTGFFLIITEDVSLSAVTLTEFANLYCRKSGEIQGMGVEPTHLPANRHNLKEFTIGILGYRSVLHESERMSLLKWQNLAYPPKELSSLNEIKEAFQWSVAKHAAYIPQALVSEIPAGLKVIPLVIHSVQ